MFKKIINREVMMYLIFGVLTTVVNIIVFDGCLHYMNYMIANIIAWFLSVLFAFITNRRFVFHSHNNTFKAYIKEGISFFSSRLTTLVIEMIILFIFIQCLQLNEQITKLVSQVIVIIANYVLSKWIVFK